MDEDKTLFNAGLAKLKRIDQLKMSIHNQRRNRNYSNWFDDLQGIREEISEKMKPDEEAVADKFEKNIQQFLTSKWDSVTANHLKRYGIYLSKLEHKYGYSMPDRDSASKALR